MPTMGWRARVVVFGTIGMLVSSCGSSSPAAPASNTFHAEVTDPAGDAVAAAAGVPKPDLVRGVADVSGGAITFTIQFAAGTLDRASTRVTIELDTDQNAATGIQGGPGVGIDYVLGLLAPMSQAAVQQ